MELEFKYGFMLISFIASFSAYTENIHILISYILIDKHVVRQKHKWAIAVRKQVFIDLFKKKKLKHFIDLESEYWIVLCNMPNRGL